MPGTSNVFVAALDQEIFQPMEYRIRKVLNNDAILGKLNLRQSVLIFIQLVF